MQRITLQKNLKFRVLEAGSQLATNNFQKMLMISAISAGIVLLSGLILFAATKPAVSKLEKSGALATVSAAGAAPAVGGFQTSSINIANNGLTYIQGARVTEITGNTIKTSMSLNSNTFDWVIETSGATKLINHLGQKQTISDIKVGDYLMVTGKLLESKGSYIINAEFVRE
ncbi:TPA: hypothetical protein DCQ44_01760 [Candidatus Taylorbacteria bacterium]|nr:hypothetical protein [Candidatus Taylorbacteria bacterium]